MVKYTLQTLLFQQRLTTSFVHDVMYKVYPCIQNFTIYFHGFNFTKNLLLASFVTNTYHTVLCSRKMNTNTYVLRIAFTVTRTKSQQSRCKTGANNMPITMGCYTACQRFSIFCEHRQSPKASHSEHAITQLKLLQTCCLLSSSQNV